MRIKHILLVFVLTLSLGLFAQHNEEVTIEGVYRPKVNKVDKIMLKPDTPEQVFAFPDAEAKVLDIEHRFQLNLDKLSPMNLNFGKSAGDESAKNFLMAGFGSRISPLFLYRHNSKLSKNLGLGVGVKHCSSWMDIKDYAPSGFMNNALEVGLTSGQSGSLRLGGKVYYKNDVYHYYGIKLSNWTGGESALSHAAPRQIYNTVGARFALASTTTRNGEFVHDMDFDYHYLFGTEKISGKEHYAGLSYDLGYIDSWWGKKSHPQKVGVALGVQYANDEFTGLAASNRLLFKVNPYFEMKDDFFSLHLGVRMDGATQFTTTTDKLLTVHPDVKGSLFVLDRTLEFYAGLNGGRKMFTYSELTDENPFVATQLNLKVATVKLGFEGGIRTNILNTVDLHAGVRYRQTDNDMFYYQLLMPYGGRAGDRPYNSYEVIYDDTRQVSVLGDVRWLALNSLTVDASFAYHNYTMTKVAHPWFRPQLEGDLKLDYRFTEAFAMNMNFLYQGKRWGMKDVFDLGLGADYKVKDQFSVFLKADNLLNQKYERYFDYPVTGIEFFAGLKLSF